MAEADVYTKNYISQNDVFADVFNFFVYGGKQVIHPESLSDENVEEDAIVPAGEERAETEQRYRDVLKSCVVKRGEGVSYVLLGIENQSHVHYAMPVRAMLYDALQYDKQVKAVAASHRQKSGTRLTAGEFLSGFANEDRLIPVITLVVYFGCQRWDAPRSLHQMFAQTYDEQLMRFAQDYTINLIEPASLSEGDLATFATDFGRVMEFLKYSNDKQKVSELLSEGSPYESISTSAALVLNSCAGIGIKINQYEEKTNMCKAIQELKQEAVDVACKALKEMQQEAVEKAVEETTVNSLLRTARALMETLHLPAEQVLKAMKLSESEQESLRPMLQV